MPDVISYPSIISPAENSVVDFSEPLNIEWDSKGNEVIRFYLRVGTNDGNWDLFSAEVGKRINHLSLDISSLPANVQSLYLKLAYTQMMKDRVPVKDKMTGQMLSEKDVIEEVEMEPEVPLIINRRK